MKHDFIQMSSTAGLTIPDSINSIFQHIFECFCFKLTNSNFDFLFQVLNCLWVVSVTFILDSFPLKIVQRRQIEVKLSFI